MAMKSSITTLGVAMALAMGATAVNAGGFQTEAGGSYTSAKGDTTKMTRMGVSATHYLQAISASGPLAEAAFLNPTNNVNVGAAKISFDNGVGTTDMTEISLGYNHVIDQLLVGASYGGISSDGQDSTEIGVNAGYYVDKQLMVGGSYASTSEDSGGVKDTVTEIGVNVKWLNSASNAYSVELGYTSESSSGDSGDSSDSILDLAATYYLDNTLGLGATYQNRSGDDKFQEGTMMGVGANKFFTDTVSAEVAYIKFSAGDTNFAEDYTVIQLGVNARF